MSEFIKSIADFMLMICQGNPYIAILLMTAVPLVGLNGAIPLGALMGVSMWQTFWLVMLGRAILTLPLLLFWRQIFALGKKLKISRWFVIRVEQLLMSKAEKANSSSLIKMGHDYGADSNIDSNATNNFTKANVSQNSTVDGNMQNIVQSSQVDNSIENNVVLDNIANKSNSESVSLNNNNTNTNTNSNISSANREQLRKFFIIISYASLPIPLLGVWTSGAVATMMGTKFWVAVPALLIANLISGLLVVLLVKLFGDSVDILLLIAMIVAILAIVLLLVKIFTQKHDVGCKM